MPKALISTLAPISGGVPGMAALIAGFLEERGFEPTLVYYQPYSLSPHLSVPLHRLARSKVARIYTQYRGFRSNAVGAWLPELEFTHYLPTVMWRDLIGRHDVHLTVSGNCLAATSYAMTAIPFWAWVATDWAEDRQARADKFPWYRRIMDRLVNAVGVRRLERKILNSGGTIVALSEHTKKALGRLSSTPSAIEVMPMGIDTDKFTKKKAGASRRPNIGFVGRLDDPRKNIDLLLSALVVCRDRSVPVGAILVGDSGQDRLRQKIAARGLSGVVSVLDYVENDQLPSILSEIDLFVIPSHQEGLCIAALEAMSCGVPVISTRCGGPQEFVVEGETGFLVDSRPDAVAAAIQRVVTDEELRSILCQNSRRSVRARYSVERVSSLFWASFESTFPQADEGRARMGCVL